MSAREHCALARANRVFGTDKKRIRTKNTVMNKGNNGLRLHSDNKRNPATAGGAVPDALLLFLVFLNQRIG